MITFTSTEIQNAAAEDRSLCLINLWTLYNSFTSVSYALIKDVQEKKHRLVVSLLFSTLLLTFDHSKRLKTSFFLH